MHVWDAIGSSKATWMGLTLDTRIRIAASMMLGWRYRWSGTPTCRPFTGALTASFTGADRTVYCSAMTIILLCAAFPDAPWDGRSYGDLQCYAERLAEGHPDSPIDAVERAGVGTRVDGFHTLDAWYLVQGWWSLGAQPAGHAVLIYRDTRGDLWVLQSASGVGPTFGRTSKDPHETFGAGLYIARLGD
jgi:hypothetical protein